MCIPKVGKWPMEKHLLCCEASLKRGQQPFAISEPSLLFFLVVLLCFLLEQTSCELTQMRVFVLTENRSFHGFIVLTQTNVLLLILHSLELRQSVSCGYFVTHASSDYNR